MIDRKKVLIVAVVAIALVAVVIAIFAIIVGASKGTSEPSTPPASPAATSTPTESKAPSQAEIELREKALKLLATGAEGAVVFRGEWAIAPEKKKEAYEVYKFSEEMSRNYDPGWSVWMTAQGIALPDAFFPENQSDTGIPANPSAAVAVAKNGQKLIDVDESTVSVYEEGGATLATAEVEVSVWIGWPREEFLLVAVKDPVGGMTIDALRFKVVVNVSSGVVLSAVPLNFDQLPTSEEVTK